MSEGGTSKESKAAAKRAQAEAEVMANIAEMPDADREIAERIHELVKENAPQLEPRLWYGMPAYAKDGKVICFFQSASKFKTRYGTLGFQHDAQLDDGAMWPVAFAVTQITSAEEARIIELLKRSVG